MQREIEVDNARDIEFQRVHRMRFKKLGSPQPIISRFLLFHDRQRVFKRALDVKNETCKIYADFPKGITPSYIPKGIARSYISNFIHHLRILTADKVQDRAIAYF